MESVVHGVAKSIPVKFLFQKFWGVLVLKLPFSFLKIVSVSLMRCLVFHLFKTYFCHFRDNSYNSHFKSLACGFHLGFILRYSFLASLSS